MQAILHIIQADLPPGANDHCLPPGVRLPRPSRIEARSAAVESILEIRVFSISVLLRIERIERFPDGCAGLAIVIGVGRLTEQNLSVLIVVGL